MFQYESKDLFNRSGWVRLLDVVAGRHVFRVVRNQDLTVSFTHACPGTGTRKVSVSMSELRETTKIQVCLTWHPDSISLSLGPLEGERKLLRAEGGSETAQRLIVGDNGQPYEIGDAGLEISSFRAYEGEQLVVEPAAIEIWQNTLDAIGVLHEGRVEEDTRFEIVQANAIVTMLVTGFEAYSQKRFQELSGEGNSPDLEALANTFPRIQVDDAGRAAYAAGDERGVLPYVARTGINFQNYEELKKAYKVGYGLHLTRDADISSESIQKLKAAISHRHRVIHVSPLEVIRSMPGPGQRLPEIVNRAYADETIALFAQFIKLLHASTLALRPADVNPQGDEIHLQPEHR